MGSRVARLFARFEGDRDPHVVALFRVAFFGALAVHFFPSLIWLDAPDAVRAQRWSRWLYEQYPAIPRGWLRAGAVVTMTGVLMGLVGWRPRVAATISGLGLYAFASFNAIGVETLGLSTVWAILPLWAICGGGTAVWSVDAWLARGDEARREPALLPSLILATLLITVFFAGVEKLVAGWPFNNEMAVVLAYPKGVLTRDWAYSASVLQSPIVTHTLSWLTVVIELSAPILLLFRATRIYALWAYELLFLGIIAMLEVPPLFYLIFAPGALLAFDGNILRRRASRRENPANTLMRQLWRAKRPRRGIL